MSPQVDPLPKSVLLLDTRSVSRSSNAHLVPGPVTKSTCNPLFGEDYFADPPRKWEARFDNVYPSVAYDPDMGKYRAWYFSFLHDGPTQDIALNERAGRSYRSQDRIEGLLYAESSDGLTWVKPELGLIEFGGSSANNIVMSNLTHGIHAGGVMLDERDPDSSRRFKAIYRCARDRHMAVAFSSDGITWTDAVLWPNADAVGDTHSNAVWVSGLDRYVAITRGWTEKPYHGERTVLRTESSDFVDWSEPVEVLRGDGLHDQIYSMPIAHHGNGFIGLPAVFHKGDPEAENWDTVDTELAFSPDGRKWHRICAGQPFIPRGPGSYPDGAYDAGCVYASAPIVGPDGGISLYYGGSNGLHNSWREGSLNLATIPRDRYAGMAPGDVGRRAIVRTSPVVLGDELTINAAPGDGGSTRVAVLDLDGRPIEGFSFDHCEPITVDDVAAVVRWHPSAVLPNHAVYLEFEMSNVTIFAFNP